MRKGKASNTYSHRGETRQSFDSVVNVFGRDGIAVLLQLVLLEAHAQLISRLGAVYDFEFSHEHDPGASVRACNNSNFIVKTYMASTKGVSLLKE